MVERLYGMHIFSFSSTYLDPISCSIFEKKNDADFQDRKNDEYMALEQCRMTLTTYKAKFHTL